MDYNNDQEITILGVDPGTIITGFGVIKASLGHERPIDYGCIRPPAKLPLHERHLIIHNSINMLIEKFSPDAISVETQFVKKNIQVAMKLGMTRGVILLSGALHKIPIFEYAPRKAKLSVVGSGAASKEQVQRTIKMLLKLEKIPTPEDAADGLALAICHAHEHFKQKRIFPCMNT